MQEVGFPKAWHVEGLWHPGVSATTMQGNSARCGQCSPETLASKDQRGFIYQEILARTKVWLNQMNASFPHRTCFLDILCSGLTTCRKLKVPVAAFSLYIWVGIKTCAPTSLLRFSSVSVCLTEGSTSSHNPLSRLGACIITMCAPLWAFPAFRGSRGPRDLSGCLLSILPAFCNRALWLVP